MEPDTSSDPRPVIPASEILAKIERGEDVEYDGVIVVGDLDIRGLELPTQHVERTAFDKQLKLSDDLKLINQRITITNSEIRGTVNFSNTLFRKQIKFKRATFSEDVNFLGAKFGADAYFGRAEFGGNAYFNGTGFGEHTNFRGTKFAELAVFRGVKFGSGAYFIEAKFGQDADFGRNEFVGHTFFTGAEFGGHSDFSDTKFGLHTNFEKVDFGGDADFSNAKFGWYAGFKEAMFWGDANFGRAEYGMTVDFDYDQFRRNLSFKYAKFARPRYQELACRIAKRKMEDLGNKNDADYYFYREMEATRIQNGIKGTRKLSWPWKMQVSEWLKLVVSKIWRLGRYDIFEYIFIQGIFGYGVRPLRLFGFWILMALTFASIYWYYDAVEGASAWFDYIWFSIATSATPGYALYNPIGHYKIVTGIQAIIGTFMWAAFIATFARKWQR